MCRHGDGTKYYVTTRNIITQHNLSTAYDIDTVTSTQTFDTNVIDPGTNLKIDLITAIDITDDGTKVIVLAGAVRNASNVNVQDDALRSYTLSTPDDITTASMDAASFLVGSLVGGTFPDPTAMCCDGTAQNIYFMGFTGSTDSPLRKLLLGTPGDLSTAVLNESFTLPNTGSTYQSLEISSDGSFLYAGTSNVYKYELSTPNSLASQTLLGQFNPSGVTNPQGMAISADQNTLVLCDNNDSEEYDVTVTTLSPNPDSFRLGYATADAPANTDFVALLDTKGEVPYVGAVVGDTLTSSGAALVLNGLGELIGVCIKDDTIQILGDD